MFNMDASLSRGKHCCVYERVYCEREEDVYREKKNYT